MSNVNERNKTLTTNELTISPQLTISPIYNNITSDGTDQSVNIGGASALNIVSCANGIEK